MIQSCKVIYLKKITADIFILRLVPLDGDIFDFHPGQYANLFTSNSSKPHFFSIASSPTNTTYYEFAIRIYGDWTKKLSETSLGDQVNIEAPVGSLYWKPEYRNCVFLVGGVAISGIISMLRFIADIKEKPLITLLYGNRNVESILYRDEVESLIKDLGVNSKVVHVLSDLKPNDPWNGYRGFLTEELIRREVDFSTRPTFFVVGPQVFNTLMQDILVHLHIDPSHIIIQSA